MCQACSAKKTISSVTVVYNRKKEVLVKEMRQKRLAVCNECSNMIDRVAKLYAHLISDANRVQPTCIRGQGGRSESTMSRLALCSSQASMIGGIKPGDLLSDG